MRIINRNLSITYPSIGTSPMSLASQVMANRHSRNCIGMFKSPFSIHFIFQRRQPRHNPYGTCQREPILRYINFQLSPTHCQVLWLYGKAGLVSHPNPTISFCQKSSYHSVVIFTFKIFLRMILPSKIFIVI